MNKSNLTKGLRFKIEKVSKVLYQHDFGFKKDENKMSLIKSRRRRKIKMNLKSIIKKRNISYGNKKNPLTSGLIEAHLRTRSHIKALLEGISEDDWIATVKGPWNLKSLGIEILNFEIRMINKAHPVQFRHFSDDTSYLDFKKKLTEISNYMICAVEWEQKTDGFLWKSDQFDRPSMHWVMMRTNSHDIYHAGGLTVVREHLGFDRANYSYWPAMADAPFLAGLKYVKQNQSY